MRKYLAVLGIFLLLVTCKSPPPPQDEPEPLPPVYPSPSVTLEFERIEAVNVKQAAIHYRLKANNPRSQALDIELNNWEGLLDEIEFNEIFVNLNLDDVPAAGLRLNVEPLSSLEEILILQLGLTPGEGGAIVDADGDEYSTELSINLRYHYEDHEPLHDIITANTAFPRIREPDFTITSITILQADLINTRLKLGMRIDNPNIFPVTLSSFRYDLYGDGNLWGNGTGKNFPVVPAQSSTETSFEFETNFINMRRRFLDDIIALRHVRYRVRGDMEVGTDIEWLPKFRMNFDHSGNSAVLRN